MNNGGGNGGGSFKVKHGSYAAEVTNVHEAGLTNVCTNGFVFVISKLLKRHSKAKRCVKLEDSSLESSGPPGCQRVRGGRLAVNAGVV